MAGRRRHQAQQSKLLRNPSRSTGRFSRWGNRCRPGDEAKAKRNPIDAFLAHAGQRAGNDPPPPARRDLLFRRLWVDLVGLPPTRAELASYLADASPTAYDAAVDRLLDSKAYGERWARHWMDVWRYSEPDGRKAKADIRWSNEHVWRWRDWIVDSLNADKGYDRMVQEMLAGDELHPDDPQALAATGFLVRNWYKLDRNIGLNNTIEHTAKAFLGMTLACARCHDHKFDPVSQKEYYAFRAFFEPHDIRAESVPCDPTLVVARAFDARPDEPTYLLARGDPKAPDRTKVIAPGLPRAFGGSPLEVVPGESGRSTGRRLALARWITDRRNPLAVRIAVNHVWARHFGWPLVENVADFGTRTPAPRLQELLDWLAADFMEHGWSQKRLHRLIVTSQAYQSASSTAEASAGNRDFVLLSPRPRRMEAEVVRDSLLHLSGALDTAMGGPPLDHLRGEDTARRSLYYRYSREDKMEFLKAFDAPGVEECYRREESIVPQQALALENSEFVWDQARRIARRLEAESTASGEPFLTAAFEHLLGRLPTSAEAERCERFLAGMESMLAHRENLTPFPLPPAPPPPPDAAYRIRVPGLPLVLAEASKLPRLEPDRQPAGRAREFLIHALLNHNDFITVR